jgi:hypothetical protein
VDFAFSVKAGYQMGGHIDNSFGTEYFSDESGSNLFLITFGWGSGAIAFLTMTMLCGDWLIELTNSLISQENKMSKMSAKLGLLFLTAAIFFSLENPWCDLQAISGPLAIATLAYSIATKDYKWLCYAAGAAKLMSYVKDSLDTSIKDVGLPVALAVLIGVFSVIGESPLTMTSVHKLANFINELVQSKHDSQTNGYIPQINMVNPVIIEEPAGLSDLSNKKLLAYESSKIIANAIANAFLIWDPNKPIARNLWPAFATWLVSGPTCGIRVIGDAKKELQLINFLTHNRLNDDDNKHLKSYLNELLPKVTVSSPTAAPASNQIADRDSFL